jgi:uncharacterized DUF497 family protein
LPIEYDDEEITKHGLSRRDVDLALRSEVWEDMGASKRGNDRIMFVGFSEDGRLIEVGVEYFDKENKEWAFHADLATPKYQKFFKSRMKS